MRRYRPSVLLSAAALTVGLVLGGVAPATAADDPAASPTTSVEPTAEPTAEPTTEATDEPVAEPTADPTVAPTEAPTPAPTTPSPLLAPRSAATTQSLAAPQAAALLSGRVTSEAGDAIAGATVWAQPALGGSTLTATTDADGNYSFTTIAAGSYRLQARPAFGGWVALYYPGVVDWSAAELVAVGTTPGEAKDFVLPHGGSVTGTVTVPAGYAVTTASVTAEASEGGPSYSMGVRSDGTYSVDSLPAGNYKVRVWAPSPLYGGYYPGMTTRSAAQAVTVTAGTPHAGIDFALAVGSTITGVLTRWSGGALANANVYASTPDYSSFANALTDASGAYTLTGVAPGKYRILFTAPDGAMSVNAYYGGATAVEDATLVDVGPGASVTASQTLTRSALVNGRVTGPDGQGLAGVTVFVESDDYYGDTETSDGGFWEVHSNLGPGTYTVRFGPWSDESLAFEYYDDAMSEAAATTITLGVGTLRLNVDAQLDRAAALQVSLTDEHGAPAREWVSIDDGSPNGSYGARTDAAGIADLTQLHAGSGRIAFGRGSGDTPYVPQYYKAGGPTTTDRADASVVTWTGGATTNVSAVLRTGAHISGVVRNADGSPVANRMVVAFADDGVHATRSTTTGADGSYSIQGLLPGSYFVALSSGGGLEPDVFYGTGLRPANPNVAVTGTATTAGIDIVLGGKFADVQPSTPFATDIAWLSDQGITQGSRLEDGTLVFDSSGPVRREAMAAFLYRAKGSPAFTAPAVSPFVDVAPGAPFYKEICWLASTGISTGTDVGNGQKEFRPAESVSREAMAAFLYRFKGSPAFTIPSPAPFVDVASGDRFAKEIAWLASVGISNGTDIGGGKREYRALEPVRRDAMAAFLHRAVTVPG
ncbi:carboxypeptidase regulatory-like domain-containing protein [Cellulomonas sp.]|uniref:carboxypeptidase regulatory-like domain-containing protein n=1 Tax=Cellulomonas sp. TaxID=40001 RepID=UPI001B12159E|nr:carboxypeptidase regulatory-like domain-containing protein [Cellulomonas sp.]MBO9555748.1 carboxypeptidase regulatory-like domain-containing protein [Cellulomonas sp.]